MRGMIGALLLLASIALSLALASTASARPGDLDPTYGDHGLADWSGVDGVEGVGNYMALDDSGRLLTLARTPGDWSGRSTAVARTTPAGTPDASFGDGGAVDFSERGFGLGLAVQPDGRILVLLAQPDEDGNCPCRSLLYRLLPDGRIDPTLNGVEVPIDANLQVDPSGRILGRGGLSDVVGLTPDGELDPAFGDGGVVAVDKNHSVIGLARDPTGGYLVGYMKHDPFGYDITKIDADGDIDADWGSDGVAHIGGGPPGQGPELAVSPNGRVAVGESYFPYRGTPQNWLVVLDPDGTPASDFDSQPALTLPMPSAGFSLSALAWDHQGRLLMAGRAENSDPPVAPDPCTAFIARFRQDGSRDDDFAESGLGLFPERFSTFPSCGLGSLLVQPDGRILADAAPTTHPNGLPDRSPTVARFLAARGGPADADADGVVDSEDACPRRGAEHPDGCQRADVAIDLKAGDLTGTAAGPPECSTEDDGYDPDPEPRAILLFRKRPGSDKLVGRTRLVEGRFEFGSVPLGHAYYAQLERLLRPGVVVCRKARSPAVVLLKLALHAPKRQQAKRKLHARARCVGLGCKLRGRAVVKLRRPGRKNLKLHSGRVKEELEAGERKRLTFKLKRRDARRLKRSVRNSSKVGKRSRVVFRATARDGMQIDWARANARLRRG